MSNQEDCRSTQPSPSLQGADSGLGHIASLSLSVSTCQMGSVRAPCLNSAAPRWVFISSPVHQATGTRDVPGSRVDVGRVQRWETQTYLGKGYSSESGCGLEHRAEELELSLVDGGEPWEALGQGRSALSGRGTGSRGACCVHPGVGLWFKRSHVAKKLGPSGWLSRANFPPFDWVRGPQGTTVPGWKCAGHRREGQGSALMSPPLRVPQSVSPLLGLV